MCSIGWRGEGIGWYGTGQGKPVDPVQDYKEVYRPVINEVRAGLRGTKQVPSQYLLNDPIKEKDVYYSIADLNGDGVPELAICDRGGLIYLLYTSINRQPKYVDSGWSRSQIYYVGGKFSFHGSGGMGLSYCGWFTLTSQGQKKWSQYNFSTYDMKKNVAAYYTNTSGSDNPAKSSRISQAEFNRRDEAILKASSALSLNKLSSY